MEVYFKSTHTNVIKFQGDPRSEAQIEHEQALPPTFLDMPMIYWDYLKGHTHPYDQVCKAATHTSNFCDVQNTLIGALQNHETQVI